MPFDLMNKFRVQHDYEYYDYDDDDDDDDDDNNFIGSVARPIGAATKVFDCNPAWSPINVKH